MASVTPGVWMLTNSHLPSNEKVAPAHSRERKTPMMAVNSIALDVVFGEAEQFSTGGQSL